VVHASCPIYISYSANPVVTFTGFVRVALAGAASKLPTCDGAVIQETSFIFN